ncbi:diacylglycerol kinase family protein [Streptomyces sp. NPDC088184]|uniref:diacylglycerol/lipid kinase family protein n=1 Tax=unclassified Streptomyces TaxID=2593676 RepID=UPI00341B8D20
MADFPVPRLESCLVVANPRAGSVTRELIDDVAERCARRAEVRLAWTAGPGDATAIAAQEAAVARSSGVRVVVAVGGDGTVLEVVEGLVGDGRAPDGVALLVVPGGTGNSDYRSHWGERPWQQALEQALGDGTVTPRRLDLARVRESGELIVLGAGVGLTAEVLRSARGIELRGKDRLRAGLDHAATHYTPFPGRVTVDGIVVHKGETVLANVGGGRHRAWQFLVLPDSVLDDGLLDVCVMGAEVPATDVPELLRTGAHVGLDATVYTRGRRVVLERTDGQPLCFEHDGELIADCGSRLTVDVLPGALPVLCAPADPSDPR